jgi:hypothetical protein
LVGLVSLIDVIGSVHCFGQASLIGWLSWAGLVWFGLVWFGLVWFGLVWFGWVESSRFGLVKLAWFHFFGCAGWLVGELVCCLLGWWLRKNAFR